MSLQKLGPGLYERGIEKAGDIKKYLPPSIRNNYTRLYMCISAYTGASPVFRFCHFLPKNLEKFVFLGYFGAVYGSFCPKKAISLSTIHVFHYILPTFNTNLSVLLHRSAGSFVVYPHSLAYLDKHHASKETASMPVMGKPGSTCVLY